MMMKMKTLFSTNEPKLSDIAKIALTSRLILWLFSIISHYGIRDYDTSSTVG
jgi:hypothetical protein